MLESGSFQILHRDEGLAFMLSDFINRANAGMIQGRSRTGFAPEAFQGVGIENDFLRKKFEGNEAGRVRDPRPCTLPPSRRPRASPRHGSAKYFSRSQAANLTCLKHASQREQSI